MKRVDDDTDETGETVRGRNGAPGKSHEEIGRLLGISGARVHQIEKRALAKLREAAKGWAH